MTAVMLPAPELITREARTEIRNRYRRALAGYAANSVLGRAPGCWAASVRAESDRLLIELAAAEVRP